eukprot:GHVU01028201.1.p1 GENE.GHVU01028201.1~~GHVU01028201.1.p1  ORF type:complete len:167 (+),score=19.39 GHVU01028201.1:28-501(+)
MTELTAVTKSNKQQHHLTVMLLTVAISFVVLRLPYTVVWFIVFGYDIQQAAISDAKRSYMLDAIKNISYVIASSNYTITTNTTTEMQHAAIPDAALPDVLDAIKNISYVIATSSYTINFFLYCITGQAVRKRIIEQFIKIRNLTSVTSSQTSSKQTS